RAILAPRGLCAGDAGNGRPRRYGHACDRPAPGMRPTGRWPAGDGAGARACVLAPARCKSIFDNAGIAAAVIERKVREWRGTSELDDVLGLTEMAGDVLADARSGKNGRHPLAGLFRQSVFGRLVGYEDVNDAEHLRHDPAMRWIVGGKAAQSSAASPSQMGRFETQWLAAPKNFAALADLSGQLPVL